MEDHRRRAAEKEAAARRRADFCCDDRTAFTVRCGDLFPDVFLNARRDTMMRRGFTMLVVGLEFPVQGHDQTVGQHIWVTSGIGSFSGAATCICAAS